MKRIYFDSNIFRELKKNTSENSLFEKIIKAKDRLLFLYSHAHLLDLQEDKTDYKFKDLLFMEKLVDNNYLFIEHKKEHANLQLATPTEAFKVIGSGYSLEENLLDFDDLFNLNGLEVTPELKKAKEKLNKALSTPLQLNLKSNIEKHQNGNSEVWEKLLPEIKDEYSMKEWFKVFSKMLRISWKQIHIKN